MCLILNTNKKLKFNFKVCALVLTFDSLGQDSKLQPQSVLDRTLNCSRNVCPLERTRSHEKGTHMERRDERFVKKTCSY